MKNKCFIRMNNPEIIEFLENNNIFKNEMDTDNYPWIAYNHERMYITVQPLIYSEAYAYNDDCDMGYDCGHNVELFKSLVLYSEKTDKNQWFVSDVEQHWVNQGMYAPKGTFNKSLVDKFPLSNNEYHKATIDEIVEYFKKEEQRKIIEPDFDLMDKEPLIDLYSPENECLGSTNNFMIFDDWRAKIKEVSAAGYYFKHEGQRYNIETDGRIDYDPFKNYIDILMMLM